MVLRDSLSAVSSVLLSLMKLVSFVARDSGSSTPGDLRSSSEVSNPARKSCDPVPLLSDAVSRGLLSVLKPSLSVMLLKALLVIEDIC